MHYTPHILYAFNSVEHIMRDVNYGWLLRYLHANGASFFFIMVYMHMGKGLYYTSFIYPYVNLWRIGVVIFLLMMATAFMGYVLPWGQMSFRGATVITNLFTAIPFVGDSLAYWLWGGYSVDNATLNRFFSIHYVLPFGIIGLVLLHLVNLHIPGSSHPLKIAHITDKVNFYPYYFLKDLVGFFGIFLVYSIFVFFMPNVLGHSDNYIEANALSTPTHIVPEWYFLPFYAILRSIPDKLGGVICMFAAIVVLLLLPNLLNTRIFFLESTILVNPKVRFFFKQIFWFFVFLVIFLGWIGAKPVEDPFLILGQIATFNYFFILIVVYNFSIINELFFFNLFLKKKKVLIKKNYFIKK